MTNTPQEIARAVRVVAGYARDADDLRLLLERLGILVPEPEPGPGLPCSRQAWYEFRTGRKSRSRQPPRCRRCGSVFLAWHRCHSP